MTEAPQFLRRKAPSPSAVESGIRDIIATLKASANTEECEILAGAVNLQSAAIIRFRGNSIFTPKDIDDLLTIWQLLLNLKRDPEKAYAPRSEPQPGEEFEK